MSTNLVFIFLGVVFYLFLFWRRLREDYLPSQIFTTSFYQLAGIGLGYLISVYLLKSWVFWIPLGSSFLGLLAGVARFKLKIFEALEAMIVSHLAFFSFLILGLVVSDFSIVSVAELALTVSLIVLFFVLDKHYKKFTWYKSGRIGFSGLTVGGLFFTILAAVALFVPDVLFFTGRIDSLISGGVAFTLFFLVYILSSDKI